MSKASSTVTRVRAAVWAAFGATCVVSAANADEGFRTNTPIKHVVAIFQENVSFDHYFGTYPRVLPNQNGSVYFGRPRSGTPRVNNLESSGLLSNNPNGANPFRIDRSVPLTCDQDHGYSDEQFAFDGGLMDRFLVHSCSDPVLGPNSTLGYYDGNTVTALWNYAQYFALSDNSFGTTFGPSTPGLLNFVAGTTFAGAIQNGLSGKGFIANAATSGAVVGDADPANDICSSKTRTQILMSGTNIGDRLNAAGITWGAFMGGFGDTTCAQGHNNVGGVSVVDYIPHHAFFQYWLSTQNPQHLPPSKPENIGKTDQANHQYDLSLFLSALKSGHLPAVSILKASAYQDGHAGYSDPLDEQTFLVNTVNAIMSSPEWRETAIVILYDDSDGWYDHQMPPVVNPSFNPSVDTLNGAGLCNNGTQQGTPTPTTPLNGNFGQPAWGRCGYGTRMPLLVVSPFAKRNYVDHTLTDQTSVLRFVEDNWLFGERIQPGGSFDTIAGELDNMFQFDNGKEAPRTLILDESTGAVVSASPPDHD
jgi:phospholipase C